MSDLRSMTPAPSAQVPVGLPARDSVREWLRRQRTYLALRWVYCWGVAKFSRVRSSILLKISGLPKIVEYQGEFGPELVCFLPFVYFLWESGRLGDRKVKTYEGMHSYYYFIDKEQFVESDQKRTYVPSNQRPRYFPNRDEWFATRSENEKYPDFRKKYKNDIIKYEKPILVVSNKYCTEFGIGPLNYLSTDVLDVIFREMGDDFQIIYIRQGFSRQQYGLSIDDNEVIAFDDHRSVEAAPGVITFDELMKQHEYKYDFNLLKNLIMANTYHFISTQGGGAYNFAYFDSSIISILHKRGRETDFAYENGFFSYASSPAPRLIVNKTDEGLLRSLSAVRRHRPAIL